MGGTNYGGLRPPIVLALNCGNHRKHDAEISEAQAARAQRQDECDATRHIGSSACISFCWKAPRSYIRHRSGRSSSFFTATAKLNKRETLGMESVDRGICVELFLCQLLAPNSITVTVAVSLPMLYHPVPTEFPFAGNEMHCSAPFSRARCLVSTSNSYWSRHLLPTRNAHALLGA